MPAEARVTPLWKKQKLFVAIFLIGVALWFFIDGKWTWPRSNIRWKAHDQYEKEKRLEEWPAFAQSQGWKAEAPHKYYEQDEIFLQFILGSLCALAGGLTLLYWNSQRGRVVRSEEGVIVSPAGTRVPFTAITGLGLKKWETKGLATVRYEIEGRKGEFLLDDYKFDRDPTHEILEEIEAHLVARAK